MTSLTDAGEAW